MSKERVIDVLSEDPPISGQRFALVSIVGPHMKQKCDTWGLKIRGVTDTLEKCKSMTKKLMAIDNDYDIYNVEVGKFFPLTIEPYDVENVEYADEKLNSLVKNYLENREKADQHWEKRKRDMMKEALREGTNQKELQDKVEHPVAVLQRINTKEEELANLKEEIDALEKDVVISTTKFNAYTIEEKEAACAELKNAKSEKTDNTLKITGNSHVNSALEDLHIVDKDIKEIEESLKNIEIENSPNSYNRLVYQKELLYKSKGELLEKINDKDVVNDYINKNYNNGKESEYSFLEK